MLTFGFLGEIKMLSIFTSFISGFIFLCLAFYTIFINYVNENSKSLSLLISSFIIWSLYGVAFVFPFEKNVMYNILDIFSKNINSLLLVSYMIFVSIS